MAVAASHAAPLLAQGAGRLLRDTGDRGVVAIPRLPDGHRAVRRLPEGLAAAVLVHHRSRRGAAGAGAAAQRRPGLSATIVVSCGAGSSDV